MHFKYTYLCYLFYLFNLTNSLAQKPEGKYTYSLEADYFTGFIVKHDDLIGHLINGHPEGIHLSAIKHTYGSEKWHQRYGFPDIGYGIGYYNLKNKEQLGDLYSANVYMDMYLNKNRLSKHNFRYMIGTGVGYATNPYDRENNNQNTVVSSRISYAMLTRLAYDYQLHDRIRLSLGLQLSHFSNGKIMQPNKGVNIVNLNLGAVYHITDQKKPKHSRVEDEYSQDKFRYVLLINSGMSSAQPIGTKKLPFFTASGFLSRQLSHLSVLNLGIEFFANKAIEQTIRYDPRVMDDQTPDYKRVGVALGHDLMINNFAFVTQFGIYVYKPYMGDSPAYWRIGLKYYPIEKLFLSFSLKSHEGIAEVVEYGIGIRL